MKADLDIGGRYEILRMESRSVGSTKHFLGQPGKCRFCDSSEPTFRMDAHTFPESLGNKWVFSRDECDACNALFSRYESALTDCCKPLLTLGGVRGKKKVPQSGRTVGNTRVKHHQDKTTGRRISVHARVDDLDHALRIDPQTGTMRMGLPLPEIPFVPRHAYKALAKMAYALLPPEEIAGYSELRAWLRDPDDKVSLPRLDVLMSLASVGNAPPVVAGVLLRRKEPADLVPHIQSLFLAGSICLQIALMSDSFESHIPPIPPCSVKIRSSAVLQGEGEAPLRQTYSEPYCLNWASRESRPQPVERVELEFNPVTSQGRLRPVFRSSSTGEQPGA